MSGTSSKRVFTRTNSVHLKAYSALATGDLDNGEILKKPIAATAYKDAYVAGITFLDRTRVGWWKNGYPRFFSRIPNAPNWSGIYLRLIDEELDLAQWDVESFERETRYERRNFLPRL